MANFRVVFVGDSHLRLAAQAGDPPAALEFNFDLRPRSARVHAFDIPEHRDGFYLHRGVALEVNLDAADIDDALQAAEGFAFLTADLLSASSRASYGPLKPSVAYDVSPSRLERPFVQWNHGFDLPAGKTPVPTDVVESLVEGIVELDKGTAHRVRTSLSLYAAAIREEQSVLRFMLLWPACEALDRPLRRVLTQVRGDQSMWGLKALARKEGEDPQAVERAKDLRNDIFHVNVSDDIAVRVRELVDVLERLAVPGYLCVMGKESASAVLPSTPALPARSQLIIRGELQGDPAAWGMGTHPGVDGQMDIVGGSRHPDGTVDVTFRGNFTSRNANHVELHSTRLSGPSGPHVGSLRLDTVETTKGSQDSQGQSLE